MKAAPALSSRTSPGFPPASGADAFGGAGADDVGADVREVGAEEAAEAEEVADEVGVVESAGETDEDMVVPCLGQTKHTGSMEVHTEGMYVSSDDLG